MSIDLAGPQAAALRRAVLAGDYHLMLGAGASRESVARDGSKLPDSHTLAERLATQFDVPIEDGDLLWRLYARAVEEAGESAVYAWLRSAFWHVRPPDWMDVYARTPWAAVWTLNIDNSFEAAYSRVRSDSSRRLLTLNWDDEFRQGRELPVVHLHGCVDRDAPRSLVFSLSEYQGAAFGRAAWPINFRDEYGIRPFVVIGARLRDEPDIEAVVANRIPTHEAPSFYVSPRISDTVKRDLQRWNLIPVEMTAGEFTESWKELTGLSLDQAPAAHEEMALRVGRQFRELRTDRQERLPKGHDLFGGDEPRWGDIQRGLYAELDWIHHAKSDSRALSTPSAQAGAIIYVGRRLSGRSTGLLAIGRELRSRSWRTFMFDADERPDTDALLAFASGAGPCALLFDSIADVAEDVNRLIRMARAADLKIMVIAVDQIERAANIVGRIEEDFIAQHRIVTINSNLNAFDARSLVDKLEAVGRLGMLEPIDRDRQRLSHFRGRELFDAMAQLENAPGFGRRVAELVGALDRGNAVNAVFLSALASRVAKRLHVIDAARMLGLETDALVRYVQDNEAVRSLLSTDGQWLRTRHRWMALDGCLTALGQQAALSWLGGALTRIAPRLGRASQRERNATALLVGELMRYSNLVEHFPNANIGAWYEDLVGTFGSWSARYWEQRAIMSRHAGRDRPEALAQGESYALRAVTIVRDAFSLTTLGTVLLTRAASIAATEAPAYYDRAMQAFEQASDDDPTNLITWLAFLRHSLPILGRPRNGWSPVDPELVARIHEDWVRIYAAISSVANVSDSTQRDLAGLMTQFRALPPARAVG